MRTTVYVDGYNLYYGLLRKSRLKWLDLYALFKEHVLDDVAELVEVRYVQNMAEVINLMRFSPPSWKATQEDVL